MSSSSLAGFLEEIDLRNIKPSRSSLRTDIGNIDELMSSIMLKGLLQPLVVRPKEKHYEVVAGNRRYEACRRLGVKKVACHVVDMDEKEAFEIALVENVQRKTLDPIEEAGAFKRYVDEFGYGSVSDLAKKIGKSEEFVSHRIGLLRLPPHVLQKVSRRQLTPSHAEELNGLSKDDQLEITELIIKERISTKDLRKIVRRVGPDRPRYFGFPSSIDYSSAEMDGTLTTDRSFKRCVTALKVTLMRFDKVLDALERDNHWVVRQSLIESRTVVHQQIDDLLKLRRKYHVRESKLTHYHQTR